MPKLKLEDLAKIKEKVKSSTSLREGGYKAKITVHMGTCGIASGARKVMQALMDEIAKRDIKDVIVTTSGCAGLCSREPMATVELMEASLDRLGGRARLHWLEGADHGFHVLKRSGRTDDEVRRESARVAENWGKDVIASGERP